MKKSKILALALSAISTGILISCAKPAENKVDKGTSEGKDNLNADSKDAVEKKSDTSAAEQTDTDKKVEESAQATKDNASAVQAVELPAEKATAYLQHLSKDIIIPLYKNASDQSNALNKRAVELCQGDSLSKEQVIELRGHWLTLAASWAKAEAVNYGPAYDNMAHLYINYFPDERGLVHKSVNALIKDNPTLKPEQLIDESAIVQGVPALEDILYTNDTLDKAQCNYLVSASHELNRRFSDTASQWEKEGDRLLDTENPTTGMNQFFNGLLFHIENLKSTGIDKPLALNSKKKGHVPAHISEQSQIIVQAKLEILKDALADDELALLLADSEEGNHILKQVIDTINDTETQLNTLPQDISNADKAQQIKLYDNLTTLTKQIKRGVMPLLGVQLGFNSTDGD